jgi:hypothetical protein
MGADPFGPAAMAGGYAASLGYTDFAGPESFGGAGLEFRFRTRRKAGVNPTANPTGRCKT